MGITILTAYQTQNRCYQRGRKARHVGILVHATGAVNRNLKRYVDAPGSLGVNANGNHWNKASADKCMHGFVGYDKDGRVIAVNTLPYAYACWGCGKGSRGSYNYDPTAHVQFEICQGSNTDSAYYREAISVAAEYCAWLCRLLGLPASAICSHREAARRGYASNHGDPESWMRCFGDDMNQFRARVAALLSGAGSTDEEGQPTMETLRKGSRGEAVTALQRALLSLGYAIAVDGIFGSQSEAAVKQFQSARGLEADGVVGAITQAALRAAGGSAGTAPQAGRRYRVTVPDVDGAAATLLLETYPGATAALISA